MPPVLPPRPPTSVGVTDHDGLNHLQFRLWQILATAITLLISGWFCTMGVMPAILTVFITKHVLVAILAVGLQSPLPGSNPPK
jgi:hypothetical protein